MTQSIESMIEVMTAHKDGKKVGFIDEDNEFVEIANPAWDFSSTKYVVAPEPKKRVKYLCFTTSHSLVWIAEDAPTPCHWIRVPSEDKEIEI